VLSSDSVKLERTTNDTGNIIADRKTWTCNRRWRKYGIGYLQEAENEIETPTLFDFMEA
jgi:fructose-bisphosphate aldolase class 1